jgi:hypothetical protein
MRIIPSRRTDPDTSHKGERDVAMRADSQKYRLLAAFEEYGPIMSEEAAQIAGISPLSCYWKRCSELCHDMGYLEDTGRRGIGRSGSERIIYVITPRGSIALRKAKG